MRIKTPLYLVFSFILAACVVEVDDVTAPSLPYNPPLNTQDFSVRVRSNTPITSVDIDVDGVPTTAMGSVGADRYRASVQLPDCASAINYTVTVDGPRIRPREFPGVGRFSRQVLNIPDECEGVASPFGRTFEVNRRADFPDADPSDNQCFGSGGGVSGCSLRAAVMQANASPGHDLITFQITGRFELTRSGTDDLTALNTSLGDLDVTDDLTVEGRSLSRATNVLQWPPEFGVDGTLSDDPSKGASGVRLDGGLIDRLFQVASGATLSLRNLALVNGRSGFYGGAVHNSGGLLLERVIFANNTARPEVPQVQLHRGGALYNDGRVLGQDVVFTHNLVEGANPRGGAIFNDTNGRITLRRTLIAFNGARFGTAINSLGDVSLENAVLHENEVTVGAGGLIASRGPAQLNYVTVSNNQSPSSRYFTGDVPVNVRNSLFIGNDYDNCGNMDSAGGNVTDHTCTPLGTPLLPDGFDTLAPVSLSLDFIESGFFPLPELDASQIATITGVAGVPVRPLTDARGINHPRSGPQLEPGATEY